MTGFKQTFAGKELLALVEFVDKDFALALQFLGPSIQAVMGVITTEGPEVAKEVFAAMATAAATALASNPDKSAAAKAALNTAIAAGESTTITALTKLGEDAAHAIATANVTSAQ